MFSFKCYDVFFVIAAVIIPYCFDGMLTFHRLDLPGGFKSCVASGVQIAVATKVNVPRFVPAAAQESEQQQQGDEENVKP